MYLEMYMFDNPLILLINITTNRNTDVWKAKNTGLGEHKKFLHNFAKVSIHISIGNLICFELLQHLASKRA